MPAHRRVYSSRVRKTAPGSKSRWCSKTRSWVKSSVAVERAPIASVGGLKAQPNVVFLGVAQDGLYRTDDAGKSWRRVFEGNVRAVTVDPINEEVVYVGAEPVHLYR